MDTMEMKDMESAMEGILFAAGEPVGIDRICFALELDKPTAELLLDRALWNLSLKIARRDYEREDLNRELIMAQGEADYLLSLY